VYVELGVADTVMLCPTEIVCVPWMEVVPLFAGVTVITRFHVFGEGGGSPE